VNKKTKNRIKKTIGESNLHKLIKVYTTITNTTPFTILRVINAYITDCIRFTNHSGFLRRNTSAIQFEILRDAHKIEKAFSLPQTREVFGREVASRLVETLLEYHETNGYDQHFIIGYTILVKYHLFLKNNNHHETFLISFLEKYSKQNDYIKQEKSGYTETTPPDNVNNSNFLFFARSRRSIRNFSKEQLNEKTIHQAVEIAKQTPSVCNRQPWKVHYYSGKSVAGILKHQNGNRGFNQSINSVIIVTSPYSAFFEPGERNQGFIDGGMFAMSIIYALHSMNIASCCLNLSLEHPRADRIRKAGSIPKNEMLIMMIAIGHYNETYTVANSPRKSTDQFIQIHR